MTATLNAIPTPAGVTGHISTPLDREMAALTRSHPGLVARVRPDAVKAARKAGRGIGRSVARGWARVRGTLGSLGGLAAADVAAFHGLGLVGGLLALAASLFIAEWLLK